jgi:transposase
MKQNNEQTIEQLLKENEQLKLQLEESNGRLQWLEEQFKLLQQFRFGVKSEKLVDGQLNLFNDAEETSDETVIEPTYEEVNNYKRRKDKRSKEDLMKDLPVETIEYTLDEADRLCPHGHGPLYVIGKEITREIAMIPAKFFVIEHIRYKYACKPCEVEGNELNQTPVMAAPKPNRAIPGSMASPSLLAYILDQKYTQGLPLYRQEQQFSRVGLNLSRQTLANWMIKSADLFKVLFDRMHQVLVSKDILMADETSVQVLQEPGKAATTKSYMWVYRTGKYDNPIILFDYQSSRSGKHPKAFLADFKGYLISDGYSGYNDLDDIIRVGCLAHARRYFTDALKALPKDSKRLRTKTNEGLSFISELYKIESKIKDYPIEKRLEYRLEKSKPILDRFSAWLDEQAAISLPKSKLGEAIQYTINQWDYLKNYLLDGRLEIDNNRTERSIRPFVTGRKGWLFSNTPKGATSSAIIYSIVETAKENKLKPYDYMKYLLEQIPNMDDLDQLLPWSDTLPNYIKL